MIKRIFKILGHLLAGLVILGLSAYGWFYWDTEARKDKVYTTLKDARSVMGVS